MLLCTISEVRAGDVVGTCVAHPERPNVELIRAGTVLRPGMPDRLRDLGVHQLWLNCNGTEDLDHAVAGDLTKAQQEVFDALQGTFQSAGSKTMGAGAVRTFKQCVMDLVCDVVTNRKYAGLSQRLHRTDDALFRHAAAVAYLSVVLGVELQSYIVRERSRLNPKDAADLTPLGLAGMLSDIGKIIQPELATVHESHLDPDPDRWIGGYREHTIRGYELLDGIGAPAAARQAVLMHHQHWDGSGFPTLNEIGRDGDGPLKGREIHIFSRIVLAANTIETLMHDAGADLGTGEGQRAPALALNDFASRRFDGWFDPEVRRAVLRVIPPFPIGARVTLTTNEQAVVVNHNREMPCLPIVRPIREGVATPGEDLDLSLSGDVRVAACGGDDVTAVDYLPCNVVPEGLEAA